MQWGVGGMTKEQADAMVTVSAWILIGFIFLSVIVWFIFMGYQNTERERLKHETCMVITTTHTGPDPRVEVVSYCGDK